MTKKEAEQVKKVLQKITNPDAHVIRAIAIVDKLLARYDAQFKNQLRDSYNYEC